jgi:glycosyltransferase involved in cell wall biosynthesis
LKSFVVLNCVLMFPRKRSKVVVTFHTGELFPGPRTLQYHVLIYLLRRVDAVICVSRELHKSIGDAMSKDKGSCSALARISPYIRNPETGNENDSSQCVHGGDSEKTRIVVAGSGKPIYNWGIVCSLVDRMPQEIEWIFCVYGGRDREYWPAVEQELSKHKNVAFHFDLSSKQFLEVLESATVYFRPTESDGDSVTIHEALAAGIACVASDVVIRPEGVVCYAHGNPSDSQEKLMQAVSSAKDVNLADKSSGDCDFSEDSNATQIIDIYKRIVGYQQAARSTTSLAGDDTLSSL